jgi:hypothetical protein
MPSVILHPAPGGPQVESIDITLGETVITLMPGIAYEVEKPLLATLLTQLATAYGSVANAPACVVSPTGGASGHTFSYEVVPYNVFGDDAPHAPTTNTSGPAALSSGAYNTITWTDVNNTGVSGYKIIRTAGGPSQGLVGTVATGVQTFKDDGSEGAATAYTPSASNPPIVSVLQGQQVEV